MQQRRAGQRVQKLPPETGATIQLRHRLVNLEYLFTADAAVCYLTASRCVRGRRGLDGGVGYTV